MHNTTRTLTILATCTVLCGCADDPDDAGDDAGGATPATSGTPGETTADADGTGTGVEPAAPPLELADDLCSDPGNMDVLLASPAWSGLVASGGFNQAQVERMVQAPTEGPFYMVNLIRFREWAVYPDGRDTDLTGREANSLYDPTELIAEIGGGVVFNTDVSDQIDGEDILWENVAIVEYPCPVAFFAMLTHPEFQERAVHKEAGVETTIVLVTDLVPSFAPEDADQSEAQYPPTPQDPAFDLIHVMDFHEVAQYEPGSGEPERTGEEAWGEYQKAGRDASVALGHQLTGAFEVQGVFLGDARTWDEIQIVRMSSQAGFEALLDDPTREAGKYHRAAALAHVYSMITFPALSQIPRG